jgi:hypothetical protein
MRETEKFRTERLVARSWQIEDLPLAMELWGDAHNQRFGGAPVGADRDPPVSGFCDIESRW